MRRGAALLGALMLAGCARQPRVAIEPPPPTPVIVPVEQATTVATVKKVTERCPDRGEAAKLRAARPRSLREQKMPSNPAERVATITAQLGLYEANGGWADQVEAALARCARAE